MAKSASSFKNLVDLLQKTGFVTQALVNGTTGYANGPSGTLLRQNISRSWWESMVVKSEATFPVTCHTSNPLMFFHDIFTLRNKTLPFSIAHIDKETPSDIGLSNELHSLLDSSSQTSMRFQHVCPSALVNQKFDQLVNLRVNWWKQFSWKSTDFVQSQAGDGEMLGIDIKYEFPWGQETIETIRNQGENPFRALEEVTGTSCKYDNGKKQLYPSCLDCRTWMEVALVVFLNDAYTETPLLDDTSPIRQVLHIHPMLAPFKAALCHSGAKVEQIEEVSAYISRTLRTAGIQILDTCDRHNTMQTQIQMYDSIGVPFTIVVSDNTIETGTVELRNRETTVHETMAISRLEEYILKHVTYSH